MAKRVFGARGIAWTITADSAVHGGWANETNYVDRLNSDGRNGLRIRTYACT